MRKLFIFALIYSFVVYSCKRKETVPPTTGKTPEYKKAESFIGRNADSAFYYFNKIATSSKDSFQVALAYTNMGLIQSSASDFYGCQESMLLALRFLNESDPKHYGCLGSVYNELAASSSRLQNYDMAISFYDKAFRFLNQRQYQLTVLNNKAIAFQKKKNYRAALKIYETILPEVKRAGVEYARILSNSARTRWLLNPRYYAAPQLLSALRIRLSNEDRWGQNASYSHLADYYTNSKPDSALFFAQKRYAVAMALESPDDQVEALEKLIELGSPRAAKQYFPLYQHLSDSIQAVRNAAKNQFALIRYESAKNKSDNLKLQKENAEKRYEIIRQRVLLYGVLIAVILAAAFTAFWYRRKKQEQERKTQDAIRENQLRTSKKVHDVVANGLYRIMTEVEHRDELDKDELLDKIEILYQQSRDISYEKPKPVNQEPQERIAALIKSFVTEETKVLIAGNSGELWEKVEKDHLDQLEHIIQELMVNMAKHSHATMVVIRFSKEANVVNLHYSDDGVGLPEGFRMGNGLLNTGSRIKELNGSISFDSPPERGLIIKISFSTT